MQHPPLTAPPTTTLRSSVGLGTATRVVLATVAAADGYVLYAG